MKIPVLPSVLRTARASARLARHVVHAARIPPRARWEAWKDHRGSAHATPEPRAVALAGLRWLARAQQRSASHDGGVARDFSLVRGWGTSYPETTGYIIQTLLDPHALELFPEGRDRARRMADWLVSIQLADGGFQGGTISTGRRKSPPPPVTFNTGQILIGLSAATRHLGETYRQPTARAADWLAAIQDGDGAWRKHLTSYASSGPKSYETHTAWGMMLAAEALGEPRYLRAAAANVDWALSHQAANGWFGLCCLSDADQPLTHTLGYALRGVIEAWRATRNGKYLAAARRTADALLAHLRHDGHLAGRFTADWRPAVPWVCLTGTSQIAACWLLLHQETGDSQYLDAGRRANAFVRQRVCLSGHPDTCGAVKGSFPIDGGYAQWEYPNWATKFTIDANLLEMRAVA